MSNSTDSLQFTTLDVFTSTPYRGNPLAVVTLPSQSTITQEQKQLIAREFNFSETVFVSKATTDEATATHPHWDVAIFTPLTEIPWAGHPTIGTSHFLLTQSATPEATLNAKAGPIHARYDSQTKSASARIPQAYHVHACRLSAAGLVTYQPALASLLKSEVEAKKTYPIASIVKGMTFILAELDSLDELGALSATASALPEEVKLDAHDGWDDSLLRLYCYVIESQEGTKFKLRTRLIGPREDPATGSAASSLACYLAKTKGAAGRYGVEITQGVEMGRRSLIRLEVAVGEGGEIEEVVLGGEAVVVSEGTIRVP